MTLRQWHKYASVLVLTVVFGATGCASVSKKDSAPVTASGNPVLKVPTYFSDNTSKVSFASTAVMDGYYAEAKPLLESALAEKPTAQAYQYLGTARYNLNDLEGALAAWTEAANLDQQLSGEMHNNIGNALRDLKRTDEALKAWHTALEVEPTRWTAAVNMATLLKMDGHLEDAVKVLEQASTSNTDVKPLNELLQSYRSELGHSNG